MDHDLAILSPEKTVLTYRLAGLGARIGAHLLDVVLVMGGIIGLNMAIALTMSRFGMEIAVGVLQVVSFLFPIVYFVLLEGLWNGQTLGKKASGIRVRMADGTPITFAAALTRNLMRPADMLPFPYFLGLLAMFANPRSQRIGDLVAGTVVCYEYRGVLRSAPAPHTAGIHPLEDQVGSLRGMTQEEYVALRRLADRFPELTQETQARLVKEVWEPIALRRRVPPIEGVHPIYQIEAAVMKFGREHGLL
ncbi:MAG TPA: RDD family protein [Fimbriimonas sp.]